MFFFFQRKLTWFVSIPEGYSTQGLFFIFIWGERLTWAIFRGVRGGGMQQYRDPTDLKLSKKNIYFFFTNISTIKPVRIYLKPTEKNTKSLQMNETNTDNLFPAMFLFLFIIFCVFLNLYI